MSPGSMNQRLARSFLIDCLAASVMGPPLLAQMAAAGQFSKPEPSNPTAHTLRRIDGWTVRVDDRQLAPPDAAAGTHALRFLDCNLADIREVVAAEPLAKLQSLRRVQAQRRRRWDAPVRRLPRAPLHAHRPEGNLRRDVGVLFGRKRFFPFNRAKLMTAAPEVFGLMQAIWVRWRTIPPFLREKADTSGASPSAWEKPHQPRPGIRCRLTVRMRNE